MPNKLPEDQWDETFAVQCAWTVVVLRAVLPAMRQAGGGSIINMSPCGRERSTQSCLLAPSKGAMILLTKCMALDHATENIRVNAICRVLWKTETDCGCHEAKADPEAVRRERIAVHPMGRLGRPRMLRAGGLSGERRVIMGDRRRVSSRRRISGCLKWLCPSLPNFVAECSGSSWKAQRSGRHAWRVTSRIIGRVDQDPNSLSGR